MPTQQTAIPHYLTETFRPTDSETEWGEHGLKHTDQELLGSNALEGWTIMRFMDEVAMNDLKNRISAYIQHLLAQHQYLDPGFTPETYHKQLLSDDVHYAISSWAMLPDIIGPHYAQIKLVMENMLRTTLDIKEIEHNGTRGRFIGFRIVRPGKNDHNPYHRDAWLPYWRNTVNVWIPICGYENNNTLSLIPNTHTLEDYNLLRTKKGAVIDGKTYHVPAAVAATSTFEKINPTLFAGEGLVFSPYLLHGNGVNHLPDTTRVSIELRFCKQHFSK